MRVGRVVEHHLAREPVVGHGGLAAVVMDPVNVGVGPLEFETVLAVTRSSVLDRRETGGLPSQFVKQLDCSGYSHRGQKASSRCWLDCAVQRRAPATFLAVSKISSSDTESRLEEAAGGRRHAHTGGYGP
jgi:hypothetical protein